MRIALLEDNIDFAQTIIDWLNDAEYEVIHFRSGLEFLKEFPKSKYDLCIFDSVLPDVRGADVMESLKLRSTTLPPIVFLTSVSDEEEVVRVIDSGADDYIVKPVSRPMLLSRLNALARRVLDKKSEITLLEFDNLKVDLSKRKISINDSDIKLTDKEVDLACYFFRNLGVLLSRGHLMNVVWGSSSDVETRKVDVHVSHLRSKLKLVPEHNWKLSSIYQQGYRLERLEGA